MEKMAEKKVLVAGGAGYIGSVLSEMLLDLGYRVTILDRFFFGKKLLEPILDKKGLTLLKEDTRYARAEQLKGHDAVIDLSGISNDPACDLKPDITEDINLRGTLNLAKEAKKAGIERFIFSSSCSIYGQGSELALTEDSPKFPVSLYAQMKIKAEEELSKLADENFCVTFLRNATAYGLSYRMRFDLVINIMTLYAYTKRKVFVLGGGKQWRPVVHVKDISRAFLAALNAPAEKIQKEAFNVGSNEQNYQVIHIAHMVRDVLPYTEIEVVPDDPDKRSYNVNFDKIKRVLDFEAQVSPYEGIVEIKQALEKGQIEDAIHTRTVAYYKYLLEAEQIIKEVSYNGRIF